MSGPGSALFDWDLLDEAPSVTSFTLDQAEEREKEIGRFEETILEGAGRAADALADPTAPGAQEDSHSVKCELLTQDAWQAKMQEMDAAMAQLQASPPGSLLGVQTPAVKRPWVRLRLL